MLRSGQVLVVGVLVAAMAAAAGHSSLHGYAVRAKGATGGPGDCDASRLVPVSSPVTEYLADSAPLPFCLWNDRDTTIDGRWHLVTVGFSGSHGMIGPKAPRGGGDCGVGAGLNPLPHAPQVHLRI